MPFSSEAQGTALHAAKHESGGLDPLTSGVWLPDTTVIYTVGAGPGTTFTDLDIGASVAGVGASNGFALVKVLCASIGSIMFRGNGETGVLFNSAAGYQGVEGSGQSSGYMNYYLVPYTAGVTEWAENGAGNYTITLLGYVNL